MSECVVRMEMPQHCGECNLYVNGWCYAITPDSPQEKEWYSSHKERPPMCPIICSIPEGHGELIERQPIIHFIEDGLNRGEYGHDQIEVMTEVFVAETIVPAEAERSETWAT